MAITLYNEELGLDKNKFKSRRLGLNDFPSLLLDTGDKRINISPDYHDVENMLKKISHYF